MSDVTYVRLDLFPASFTVDGESPFTGALRTIVTTDTLYVYADGSEGPHLVFEGRVDSITGRNTIGWTITLADGRIAHIKRAGGCGCGTQLRSSRPFSGSMVQLAIPRT